MKVPWVVTVGAILVLGSTITNTILTPCSALLADIRLHPDSDHAPFLHGVGSADPLTDCVLIWTRVTPFAASTTANTTTTTHVTWAVWEVGHGSFDMPLRTNQVTTDASVDHTITVDVDGLAPGVSYHYQFQVFYRDDQDSGDAGHWYRSRLGTTKTASTQGDSVTAAVMSCTSLWSGYFNLYRHLATDDTIDVVLHLGDFVYPDMNSEELHRVPYGLCLDWKWFAPAAQAVGGRHFQDNSDPYVQQMIQSLHCTSTYLTTPETALERYRWIQSLYMLDPDFRAARARHPFIVLFDNHDQLDYMSNRLPLDGSRQAAHEWVPQRTTIVTPTAVNGEPQPRPFISSLREFRFGGNLMHVIMLDTFGYSGNETMKATQGLLGDGQHAWLDNVLTNSTDMYWRVLCSGKTFMPFVLNGTAWAVVLPMAIVMTLFITLVVLCLRGELYSTSITATESSLSPTAYYMELSQKLPLPTTTAELDHLQECTIRRNNHPGCRQVVYHKLRRLERAHSQSPGWLRGCTVAGCLGVTLWGTVWIALTVTLHNMFNSSDQLTTLNPAFDTWEGQVDTMNRLFDQMDKTGTDQNNLWLTGDMHYSFAADVFRFDPANKDTILNYTATSATRTVQHPHGVKRYGVEMLPASGTRGNVDEKLGELLPSLLKPGSILSSLAAIVCNYVMRTMNPHFRYFQGQAHGYGKFTVTHTHLEASYLQFPILRITNEFRVGKTLYMVSGDNRWTEELPRDVHGTFPKG